MRLCVIEGDGIGREVVPVAVDVLRAVLPELVVEPAEAGWSCFLEQGTSVPCSTLDAIRRCGAALFGAVASPGRVVPGYRSAILALRQELDLYANIRPVRSRPGISPGSGVDLIVVRENTEDLYVGRERVEDGIAIAERVISARASRRIAEQAVELAVRLGRRKLTLVHKANVLPVSDGLFRNTALEVIKRWAERGFPIQVDECHVDVAALRLLDAPESFDVILTTNLFGDILSDAAAYWMGGLGMAPSLNLGEAVAIAEPVHGAAPDIAGTGSANPIAAILSAALLTAHVWQRPDIADRIERAVTAALHDGAHLRSNVTAAVRTAVLAHLHESATSIGS